MRVRGRDGEGCRQCLRVGRDLSRPSCYRGSLSGFQARGAAVEAASPTVEVYGKALHPAPGLPGPLPTRLPQGVVLRRMPEKGRKGGGSNAEPRKLDAGRVLWRFLNEDVAMRSLRMEKRSPKPWSRKVSSRDVCRADDSSCRNFAVASASRGTAARAARLRPQTPRAETDRVRRSVPPPAPQLLWILCRRQS